VDSFYGENDAFRDGLAADKIAYVLAPYPSHTWWHHVGSIGSAQEIAQAAPWREDDPGKWQRLERSFQEAPLPAFPKSHCPFSLAYATPS